MKDIVVPVIAVVAGCSTTEPPLVYTSLGDGVVWVSGGEHKSPEIAARLQSVTNQAVKIQLRDTEFHVGMTRQQVGDTLAGITSRDQFANFETNLVNFAAPIWNVPFRSSVQGTIVFTFQKDTLSSMMLIRKEYVPNQVHEDTARKFADPQH